MGELTNTQSTSPVLRECTEGVSVAVNNFELLETDNESCDDSTIEEESKYPHSYIDMYLPWTVAVSDIFHERDEDTDYYPFQSKQEALLYILANSPRPVVSSHNYVFTMVTCGPN